MRGLIRQYRPWLACALVFSVAVNLLMLVPALYMLQLFDRVITGRSEETLFMLTLIAVFALGVMALLETVRSRLLTAAAAALDRKLGPPVLDGLLSQSARMAGGQHLNALRDVQSVRGFLVGSGALALLDAPWLPVYLAVVFLLHPMLGTVGLVGGLAMVGIALLNERFTRMPLERAQGEARAANRYVDASVRNAEVVSALGMLPAVTRRWGVLNDKVLQEQASASGMGGAFSAASKLVRQLVQVAMLATGAYLVVEQKVTPGVMMAASIILGRALAPVELMIAGWRSFVDVRSAWQRLDALFSGLPQSQAGTVLPVPAGALVVERVTFNLKGVERPVLRGVSLDLAAGESLGLIGPSGAGKSTLARLMVGVWQPASGVVRLDGADIGTWPRERIGPFIGYVPQGVELFEGTVAENIARLGDTTDGPAVIRAAERAHVHEMILRLPKGYDTPMGESGTALSPGQRQRVALARALYGDPRLVVLDEPNANLDGEGEDALLRTLHELKHAGVTVVLVAHRPTLLGGVDKLLFLRDGAVEMFGPRNEVMARVTRGPQVVGAAG